jgi:hypothetical protein
MPRKRKYDDNLREVLDFYEHVYQGVEGPEAELIRWLIPIAKRAPLARRGRPPSPSYGRATKDWYARLGRDLSRRFLERDKALRQRHGRRAKEPLTKTDADWKAAHVLARFSRRKAHPRKGYTANTIYDAMTRTGKRSRSGEK